jgi:hypothetical protein
MFAQEIERELRMLEEYVMTDDVSDDVGESLMLRDEDFEPPEVPFQPKPTSVSIIAARESGHGTGVGTDAGATPSSMSMTPRGASHDDFSGDSNFTTMPKVDPRDEDIHQQNTLILENGPRRMQGQPRKAQGSGAQPRAQPPPPPRGTGRGQPKVRPVYDDDLHSAPTMIIDIGRVRGRGGRGG